MTVYRLTCPRPCGRTLEVEAANDERGSAAIHEAMLENAWEMVPARDGCDFLCPRCNGNAADIPGAV